MANVLSALMRTPTDAVVVRWLDRQPVESLWITSITLFEAKVSLALLPDGRRQRALEAAFAELLDQDLEHRVLNFDTEAAEAAAVLAADRTEAGRPVDLRDTQIASIAVSRRGIRATRNIEHFADLDSTVENPWA